jgi:homoprotocatechuate degradation regulator HpaR
MSRPSRLEPPLRRRRATPTAGEEPAAAPLFTRRNLPLLMLRAREQVIALFRPALNGNGVTEQQWRVVRLLLETGPLEPRQIGEQCNLSSPSLAGVLARMEQVGLVRRERLKTDQRRVSVSLTERSRSLAARMAPQIEAVYAHIEAVLGREFSERLHRTLDDLIVRLQQSRMPGGAKPKKTA